MSFLPKGRPTYCLVDLEAIRWNFRQVKQSVASHVKVLSVVKANAYGHGAPQVARALEEAGCDYFGAATVEEGIELRRAGLSSSVVVLTGVQPDQAADLIQCRLTPVLADSTTLHRLDRVAQRLRSHVDFHLKVDTGMGRIGFPAVEIDAMLGALPRLKRLRLEGILSHFSRAESVLQSYTLKQLERFQIILSRLRDQGHSPRFVHLANSAAVLTLSRAHFNMVRPGLMLYGCYPSPAMVKEARLKPALTWKTRIQQVKRVPRGTSISYGQTFTTRRGSLVATLPVGYADGYKRLLSNCGAVLVRGRRAPIVGRVCMDLTMVDVTDIGGVKQGDEVVLLGKQRGAVISVDEMAGWAKTISYEILTSISARVPRFYIS